MRLHALAEPKRRCNYPPGKMGDSMWNGAKRLFNKFCRWIGVVDWRVRAIVAAMVVLVSGTGVIYKLGIGLDPTSHFGSVFAAWVGGVALFVVAGSARDSINLNGFTGSAHIRFIAGAVSGGRSIVIMECWMLDL